MATTTLNQQLSITEIFSTVAKQFSTKIAQKRAYNQTFAELDKLSSAELADIGIARSDIARIAAEGAYAA